MLKTATKTEELTSIDTRTNRQTEPSVKKHARPTMHNAPLHANKLSQARGGLSPYIAANSSATSACSRPPAHQCDCVAGGAAAQIGALRMGLSLGNLKLIDVCCASNAIGDGQQACTFAARRASPCARARCWTPAQREAA